MKSKRRINPELKIGDRVILLKNMVDEQDGPTPGSTGSVISVFSFDSDTINYGVKWDDGSQLNLLSDVDTWMLEEDFPKGSITEQNQPHWSDDALEIGQNFKFAILRKFLNRLKDSGVVNMFGAGPYLYMGKDRIDALHKYDPIAESNSEKYEEMLNLADKAKDEMIMGVVNIIQKEGKEVTVEEVNRLIGRWAQKILMLHFNLH